MRASEKLTLNSDLDLTYRPYRQRGWDTEMIARELLCLVGKDDLEDEKRPFFRVRPNTDKMFTL